MKHGRVLLCVFALLLAGCRRDGSSGDAAPTAPAAKAGGTLIQTEHVRFMFPAGWQRSDPTSKMRIAQATIPGPGGPAELAVFYFGPGQGGGVDANLDRWISQMDVASGAPPRRESFQVSGCNVTWIDVAGTLKPGPMGMGPSTAQPGARLLGAVVEGPNGPWFFKATGPDATVSAARDGFLAMLKSIRAN